METPNDSQNPSSGLRVLLVEDDADFRGALRAVLQVKGYQVIEAATWEAGKLAALRDAPDVLILDLRLPDGDGDRLCAELRSRGMTQPMVLLTGESELDSQVEGLEKGADEYWTKPIAVRLFESRLAALVRRCRRVEAAAESILEIGGLRVDFARRAASRDEKDVSFKAKEIDLLEALWRARGAPVSRAGLLARVWKYEHVPNSRTVDNHVVGLRRKIEADPARPRFLQTVPGVGYRLVLAEPEGCPGDRTGYG